MVLISECTMAFLGEDGGGSFVWLSSLAARSGDLGGARFLVCLQTWAVRIKFNCKPNFRAKFFKFTRCVLSDASKQTAPLERMKFYLSIAAFYRRRAGIVSIRARRKILKS